MMFKRKIRKRKMLFFWGKPKRKNRPLVLHRQPKKSIAGILKTACGLLLLWGLVHIIGGSSNAVHHPAESVREMFHETIKQKDSLLAELSVEATTSNLSHEIQTDSAKGNITILTSLNPELQSYLENSLELDHARYIGIVVMNPGSGRVLAMVGFDKKQPDNPEVCTSALFPAASIFKIITAGAAIEQGELSPNSKICYSGGKYTLYRSQLTKTSKRNTQCISLQDSFAQSINPVFGIIGIHHLGKDTLYAYGKAFGFNHDFHFEKPFHQSVLEIEDNTYNWAEIASGFNRNTLISPLHGAMIASSIINNGWMVEPSLVDEIHNRQGDSIYQSRPGQLKRTMSPETASKMIDMMAETVKTGTFRSSFRNAHKDPILSRLLIGAKSGSISSRIEAGVRFDWFVGFAAEKDGYHKIAMSVMVAHDQYIGKRSAAYARNAIEHYFANIWNTGASSEDEQI